MKKISRRKLYKKFILYPQLKEQDIEAIVEFKNLIHNIYFEDDEERWICTSIIIQDNHWHGEGYTVEKAIQDMTRQIEEDHPYLFKTRQKR